MKFFCLRNKQFLCHFLSVFIGTWSKNEPSDCHKISTLRRVLGLPWFFIATKFCTRNPYQILASEFNTKVQHQSSTPDFSTRIQHQINLRLVPLIDSMLLPPTWPRHVQTRLRQGPDQTCSRIL